MVLCSTRLMHALGPRHVGSRPNLKCRQTPIDKHYYTGRGKNPSPGTVFAGVDLCVGFADFATLVIILSKK